MDLTVPEICSMLIRGFVPKNNLKGLEIDDRKYAQVKESLYAVGLELVNANRTGHYGVRIQENIWGFDEFVKSNDLTKTAKSLLVLLWGFLVAPTMALDEEAGEREYTISKDQIWTNFRKQLGTKVAMNQALAVLTRYKFIIPLRGTGAYKAGPGLYIYIDQHKMYELFAKAVIRHKVEELQKAVREEESALQEEVQGQGESES
ncbi:hypothetical protein [Desulfitobacterium chlororespirans]|uniref:MAGE domain-containing protein n=1 Tax=Desulfitobacterium chlororespirans DSM 11544 TaxID=1121395 RepID=A0A1M7RX53_9FIRM|nr:hypothetical protein [Desulfitobacterium chlororespirans]SHN50718.1 hypothetical protein SAMN02745215_00216 [Desulfitobacterium chlororespirans DSM 11544]